MPARAVFVTVGTTKFDALIEAVDTVEFAEAAKSKGFDRLVIQRGDGAYVPHNLVDQGKSTNVLANGVEIEFFDYAASLSEHMSAAELVISHAGSGSIFESLTMGKPLIVVPNPLLMDNHQAELGNHLASKQYLVCSTPRELASTLLKFEAKSLKPYDKGDPSGILSAIDKTLKFV
eukprot:gene28080-31188_t